MEITCPTCGSKTVRSREIVHKTGTSLYSGKRTSGGILLGRRGGWIGMSRSSGVRQSKLAREAAPFPLFPSLIIIIFVFYFAGQAGGFLLIGIWVVFALFSGSKYKAEWVCSKCGHTFVPVLLDNKTNTSTNTQTQTLTDSSNSTDSHKEENIIMHDQEESSGNNPISSGKTCSICNDWLENSEFTYGNRENNSYCKSCNREHHQAYASGGSEATRIYREAKRAKWAKPQ